MSIKLIHIGLCVEPPPYNGFQQAFIDVLGQENYSEISTGNPNVNSEAIKLFNEFNPDIVFMQVQAPNIIKIETVKHFYNHGCKVVNWTGDVRHVTPHWMVEMAPYVISSFSNMFDVMYINNKGFNSEYLEIGYNPLIYKPEGDKIDCPEIVFMANNYGKDYFPLSNFRQDIVTKLNKHYGARFGVFGNGWQMAKGNANHSQAEEAKHYRGAKIAINCSHFNYERYSSDRILRILGTGTFCLSHHYINIEQDYIPTKHLDTFNTIEGLINKINYYLEHEDERNKIAKAGNELVLNRNTFKHQVENIIKIAQ